jgi:ATP-dependent helicase/nuclease subunit A
MTGTPTALAFQRQRLAADPAGSAWVVASAGSGKTRVLTDRILRLLLDGARPESLLCLTYTRAAAANMATRLHATLAQWARPGWNDLAAALESLLGAPPTAGQLADAPKLLARALDAPGGMRIGTLHSFAQMLLRRFPLEAGVAPHFALVADADRADLLRDAREGVFARAAADPLLAAALDRLARRFAPEAFARLVTRVIEGGRLPADRATVLRAAGMAEASTEAGVLEAAGRAVDAAALSDAAGALGGGTDAEQARAAAMAAWLARDGAGRAATWADWEDVFITGKGTVTKTLVNNGTETAHPGTRAVMEAEGERILAIRAELAAVQAADITGALATLTAPVFATFADAKGHRAALDYADLITEARKLLDGAQRDWVLFRLDGGLDHLLVDEAQDTAPAQWQIARSLTEEFFAGAGARETTRTVFAVGDPKQSIFSFQGADVEAFATAQAHFQAAAEGAGQRFAQVALPVSFRSAPAVLDLVNAMGWPEHLAHRADAGGSVELWPLVEPMPKPADPGEDRPPEADEVCAKQLAARLKGWLGTRFMPSRGRALEAGDILVLVRRRKAFVGHLTRALKDQGVAVAGLDRLRLPDALAVQDCLAFLDALLLPEDDLNLAAVLKGPFCQVPEEGLMDLALDRRGRLIGALRTRANEREYWRTADALLEKFRGRADFADAHTLLSELLHHPAPDAPTGRAAILARLGEAAAEPLDELLQAALADSLRHPPSLQGFLHRLRTANAEIKRDADQRADAVRIMTVHGAKGLEAPLVVLADTTSLPRQVEGLVDLPDDGAPAWLPPSPQRPPPLAAAADAAQQAAMAEYGRLLYVALTRAEDALLVVGWQGRNGAPKPECWYGRIAEGFGALAAAAEAVPGMGLVRRHARPCTAAPQPERETPPRAESLPGWATAARPESPAAARVKPSGEDDEAADAPPAPAPFGLPSFQLADRAAARLRRGDLTHLLLQYLPTLPAAARADAAAAWLDRQAADLDAAGRAGIAGEVLALIAHPATAKLFDAAGLAEAPIVGQFAGRPVNGVIDRLLVTPDRILIADFKTDRTPPARAEDAPPKYLRQLAIYRDLLLRMFPGRPVEAALVFTASCTVLPLPAPLLEAALVA